MTIKLGIPRAILVTISPHYQIHNLWCKEIRAITIEDIERSEQTLNF